MIIAQSVSGGDFVGPHIKELQSIATQAGSSMHTKDWITVLLALAGLALGLWNRYEQWDDRRKRLKENEPSFAIHAQPRFLQMFDGGKSLISRNVVLDFYNPLRVGVHVDKIRIIEPSAARVCTHTDAAGSCRPTLSPDFRVQAQSKFSIHCSVLETEVTEISCAREYFIEVSGRKLLERPKRFAVKTRQSFDRGRYVGGLVIEES